MSKPTVLPPRPPRPPDARGERGAVSQRGYTVLPPSPPRPPGALLTPEEVADKLGIRKRHVQRLGIPCVRLGRKTLRYRLQDVDTWIDKHRSGG